MADITVERLDDIMVFRATGTMSYDELLETIETCYPLVTRHMLWDFRDCDLTGITSNQFMMLPAIASSFMVNRKGGKSAYVSSDTVNYGLLSAYVVIAVVQGTTYSYNVFTTFEAALEWLQTQK
ncbi:MAG TPA: hypothetical protein VN642_02495 [Dongiaceae bacterium]|nr:hypothetical protein [Dongiaceae bacterium]